MRLSVIGGHNLAVSRDLMVESVRWSVERDDAFQSLPFSLILLAVFVVLVILHLGIWERQQVERAVMEWVTTDADISGIFSADGMWDWMLASGIQLLLGDCRPDVDEMLCYIGTRGILLSDVQVRARHAEGEISDWLLHTAVSQAHLAASPRDYLGAARAQLQSLKSSWPGMEVDSLGLSFTSYVPTARMFAVSTIESKFDQFGMVEPLVFSAAVPVFQYPISVGAKVGLVLVDLIYLSLLAFTLQGELKDMVTFIRQQGLRQGLRNYAGLWNAVDWFNIVMGFISALIWVLCILAARAPSIERVVGGDEAGLIVAPMDLRVDALESLDADLQHVVALYSLLRITMGLMTVTILLKFFKAFQANARLEIVTNTMVRGANDIFHFIVVFAAIFIGFAVTGHILFGNDIYQFRSIASTVDTAFMTIMGNFGWYAQSAQRLETGLDSGMPHFVVAIWYWVLMVFVLLILINMLLAIVLKHYAELEMHITADPDALTLPAQTMHFIKTLRSSRGFVPLREILLRLESSDYCHPEKEVSQESLSAAFPDMMESQVNHLLEWFTMEAAKIQSQVQGDEVTERLMVLGDMVEELCKDMSEARLNLEVATAKIRLQNDPKMVALEPNDASQAEAHMSEAEFFEKLRNLGIVAKNMSDHAHRTCADMSSVASQIAGQAQAIAAAVTVAETEAHELHGANMGRAASAEETSITEI